MKNALKAFDWSSFDNFLLHFTCVPRNEFKQRSGVTVAFLATQSGLTRWMNFHSNNVPDEFESEYVHVKSATLYRMYCHNFNTN